ncbi:glycosyltransferase family 4 protein [Sabulibacter ruber]|uniref:glycosyltransferase family 4 protein n=1 Tax=Sabulibacter ruber TaxID=2811901 RepID=UPI001A96818C|nr:glycosyltransferase family 4 protein [Sabulibacter ruber]
MAKDITKESEQQKELLPRIHYIGFNESTGYGVAANSLVQALRRSGADVSFTGILPGKPEEGGVRTSADVPETAGPFAFSIIHTVPEYYPYWIRSEKQKNRETQVWGYTTWETDQLPDHWPALLNQLDGLFVTSHWNKEVFQKSGVTARIEVLPHVSEFEGAAEGKPSQVLDPVFQTVKDDFLFYSIGVWNERKAPWLLIEAFQQEFSKDEKVALVLKTGRVDWTSPYKRRWNKLFRKGFGEASDAFKKLVTSQNSKIYHLGQELSSQEVALLHKRGDCFISFTRGEGWGMGAYEAAWFGKAVAITAYGGALDYLPPHLAYLLDFDLVPVHTAFGQESYSSNQKWAEVNLPLARKTMRHIFENAVIAQEKGSLLRQHVSTNFSAEAIASICLRALGIAAPEKTEITSQNQLSAS